MKIDLVKYWDRIFITPALLIVVDSSFIGYKYLSLSFLKWSLELSWGHIN
jgi:hypothetical protein